MKALLITQDDPFYLPSAISMLLELCQEKHEFLACVLLSPSPFGKRENVVRKSIKTLRVFGFKFFFYYGFKFLYSIFIRAERLEKILIKRQVSVIRLTESINHPRSIATISRFSPEVLVSVAGNEIFKNELLEIAPCINLHTAPLPRYRGLMPSFWVLRNNEPETAVSVFLVDSGIDSGPIITQKTIEIRDMTQEQLIRKTKILGMQAIAEALDKMEAGNIDYLENDEKKSSYYGFPTRSDVKAFLKLGKRFF